MTLNEVITSLHAAMTALEAERDIFGGDHPVVLECYCGDAHMFLKEISRVEVVGEGGTCRVIYVKPAGG